MRGLLALAAAVLAVLLLGAAAPVVLAPGDRLQVQVDNEPTLRQNVVVASDGTIGLPLVGVIHVAGATPSAAAAAIGSALERYIRNPHVTIDVSAGGHISVLVLGDVVNSGEYQLRPGATLTDAITAAGGMAPTIDGPYPVARIALADGTTYHISLEKLLRGGDPARDVRLGDRAAIYVPGPTTFDITVLGAVDHPGTLTLNEGDRLSIALAKAGHTQQTMGDLTRVMVTRTEPDGKTASHPVDLYQALEKGNRLYDPRLRKGDIVYVPMAKQTHGVLTNAVFLLSRLFIP